MRLEYLLQFVVPLAFVGVWALTRPCRRGRRRTPRQLTRAPVPIEADLPPRHFRFTIRGLMVATLAVAILLSLPLWISIPLTFAAIFALTWLFTRDDQPLPPRPTRRTASVSGGSDGGRTERAAPRSDGVTRATRIAKLAPDQTVPVVVIGQYRRSRAGSPCVRDRL